jgi:hypothetical protein
MTRNDWAHHFINAIGAVHCDKNAWVLISWMQAEGGTAKWNPLNTTQPMPGATNYNWVGVKNYPSFEVGLEATVKTIKQTHASLGYIPILNGLRNCHRAKRTLRAVEKSAWGTGGLALRVLPYVKDDYWRYANYVVAGS